MLDTRINRHGYMIGQRSDHMWAAREARYYIDQARFYRGEARFHAGIIAPFRVAEDLAAVRFYLREAARWRRSFADRVTPADAVEG